jgi:hypothetical protein
MFSVYFPQISAAAFCFACILLVSATEGQLTRIPFRCGIVCRPEFCAVKNPSDCQTGEQYVESRRWCLCCLANCCPACVTTVGKRRCSLQ